MRANGRIYTTSPRSCQIPILENKIRRPKSAETARDYSANLCPLTPTLWIRLDAPPARKFVTPLLIVLCHYTRFFDFVKRVDLKFPDHSNLPSPLQRARQRHFIRIFQIPADRQTARQARQTNSQRLDQTFQVHRRRFAFQIRIRRQDDFLDA